jgi:hypothetical protein
MAQPDSIDCAGPRDDAAWTGRVFIVQLSLDAAPSAGTYRGRIQHLRTCDAAHFESLEELAMFMRLRTGESAEAEQRVTTGGDRS